jgi:hypothetical protein
MMVMMTRPGPRSGLEPAPQQFHDHARGAPERRGSRMGAVYQATRSSRVASAMARLLPRYIALTMFSVTFLASPSSIMVLSR